MIEGKTCSLFGSDTHLVNRLLQSDEDTSRNRWESGWTFLMHHADELLSPNVCKIGLIPKFIDQSHSIPEICAARGISRTTLYRYGKKTSSPEELQRNHQLNSKVYILVDQFEELFTQTESEDERHWFIDLLLTGMTEPRGPLLVVLTLRADFYDRLLQYPELYQLVKASQQPLFPMELEVFCQRLDALKVMMLGA